MGWIEGALLLLLWVAYGVVQSRRAAAVRAFAIRRPHSQRGATAALLLVGAVALLFGGLAALNLAGAFGQARLQLWALPLVAVLGLAFVHLQTLAVAVMVVAMQESVTAPRSPASTSRDPRNDHEEAPLP